MIVFNKACMLMRSASGGFFPRGDYVRTSSTQSLQNFPTGIPRLFATPMGTSHENINEFSMDLHKVTMESHWIHLYPPWEQREFHGV